MKNVLQMLNKHLEEVILVFGVAAMILIIFLQVVMRYVFNNSLDWSEELARYIFVWQVWLAVPYAVTKGRHIRLEIVTDIAGPKVKFVLDLIFFLVSAAFFAYVGYLSISMVQGVIKMNQLTPALQIPKWICYLSVPVGSFLGALRFLQYGWLRIRRFMKDPTDKATFIILDEEAGK